VNACWLTTRALDAGESARFWGIFSASACFSLDGVPPSAPAQVTHSVGQFLQAQAPKNKTFNTVRWVGQNFFFISIVVLVVFYLRWFRLTPFVSGDDPTDAFVVGCFLLLIFLIVSISLARTTDTRLKFMLLMGNATLLFMNSAYLFIHIPWIETTASCNGIRYFITHGAPFGDEQWTYVQMSKWKGISYESHFWGYAPGAGANEIICDEKRKEAHFVRTFRDPPALVYIDGENPQDFEGHSGKRLNNKLYFVAEDWFLQQNCTGQYAWECDVYVFTLYECESDYTNCNRLPISYTTDDKDFIDLRPDESRNEISFIEDHSSIDEEILIFTYGERPNCYVDGCTIDAK
jgi:hypothetical protein